MKKHIYLIVLLFFISNNSLLAQTGAKFGFKAGYSMATQYGIDTPDIPYTVDVSFKHGFAGGIMVYYPVTESFGVQQELLYVMKGYRENIKMIDLPVITNTEYDLNYIELPILFRYTFVRLWDIDIYGSSGF